MHVITSQYIVSYDYDDDGLLTLVYTGLFLLCSCISCLMLSFDTRYGPDVQSDGLVVALVFLALFLILALALMWWFFPLCCMLVSKKQAHHAYSA